MVCRDAQPGISNAVQQPMACKMHFTLIHLYSRVSHSKDITIFPSSATELSFNLHKLFKQDSNCTIFTIMPLVELQQQILNRQDC